MSDLWSSLDLEDAAVRALSGSVGLRFSGTSITFPDFPVDQKVNVVIKGPDSQRTNHWAAQSPTPIKENPQVPSTNSKAYKVVFTDGGERVIQANEVIEQNDRLRFVGVVEGHGVYGGQGELIASLLAENIAEYGVVPVSEEVRVGANTYRVTFVAPDPNGAPEVKVVADQVRYTMGSGPGDGQFTLVTALRGHEARTEFTTSEANVYSISRVTDTGDDVVIPVPTSGSSDLSGEINTTNV